MDYVDNANPAFGPDPECLELVKGIPTHVDMRESPTHQLKTARRLDLLFETCKSYAAPTLTSFKPQPYTCLFPQLEAVSDLLLRSQSDARCRQTIGALGISIVP